MSKQLKNYVDISRICGLAGGMSAIENMEDFNKDGVVRGLKEIATLAQGIIDNSEMEKQND